MQILFIPGTRFEIPQDGMICFKGMGYINDDGRSGFAGLELDAAVAAKTMFDRMSEEEQDKSYIEFWGGYFGEYYKWEIVSA